VLLQSLFAAGVTELDNKNGIRTWDSSACFYCSWYQNLTVILIASAFIAESRLQYKKVLLLLLFVGAGIRTWGCR
jgi:hypothetical protein